MEIEKVSIIGLGALGVLYGHHLAGRLPKENLRIIADKDRIERYTKEQMFCNGLCCDFQYVLPEICAEPADLLIFAVKYNGLGKAIEYARNQVGERTVVISLLNGITSEEIIGQAYGMDKVVYCVAQGMDAVKVGNRLTCEHMGTLCIGDKTPGTISPKTQAVAEFFTRTDIPHLVDTDMKKRLWGKFMVNVGVNQTVAVFGSSYGDIQQEGKPRDIMVSAMKEVIALAAKEGIRLNEEDLCYWLTILGTLSPEGKPSMRQDIEAQRLSEVELFSGTVVRLGKKHGLATPVNKMLYDKIKLMESAYN